MFKVKSLQGKEKDDFIGLMFQELVTDKRLTCMIYWNQAMGQWQAKDFPTTGYQSRATVKYAYMTETVKECVYKGHQFCARFINLILKDGIEVHVNSGLPSILFSSTVFGPPNSFVQYAVLMEKQNMKKLAELTWDPPSEGFRTEKEWTRLAKLKKSLATDTGVIDSDDEEPPVATVLDGEGVSEPKKTSHDDSDDALEEPEYLTWTEWHEYQRLHRKIVQIIQQGKHIKKVQK
jgi:hypothetical protein